MDLLSIVRIVAVFGLILLVIAGILTLVGRMNLPWINLPGDFVFKGENLTCAIPLATSLIFSILITILLNILLNLFRK